jgi:hypothetical protein
MEVVCKIPYRYEGGDEDLTIGKTYKVISDFQGSYYITQDNGYRCWYDPKNFYTKNELRDIKLDKLLT